MSSTRARIVTAALSAITIVVLDAGIAHASSGVNVSLTVDGQSRQVTTTAATVGGLLADQNVTVDSHDEVTPGRTSTLTGGESVTVDHTQPITVRRHTSTSTAYVSSDTFGAAVVELGIYPHTYAARAGTFGRHQDRAYTAVSFTTAAGTPATSDDAVTPHSVVTVTHVRLDYSATRRRLAESVHHSRTPLVPAGHHHVVQRGRSGVRSVLHFTKYADGVAVRRHIVSFHLVRRARSRVVQIGTGPNWYGLARCESGGNPHAVNGAGYYGLFQFSASTWHSVGGKGIPTSWGRHEQTYRAWLLFKRRGSAPWPVCGRYL
jgi:resuscitation-promoting factor RpfB